MIEKNMFDGDYDLICDELLAAIEDHPPICSADEDELGVYLSIDEHEKDYYVKIFGSNRFIRGTANNFMNEGFSSYYDDFFMGKKKKVYYTVTDAKPVAGGIIFTVNFTKIS